MNFENPFSSKRTAADEFVVRPFGFTSSPISIPSDRVFGDTRIDPETGIFFRGTEFHSVEIQDRAERLEQERDGANREVKALRQKLAKETRRADLAEAKLTTDQQAASLEQELRAVIRKLEEENCWLQRGAEIGGLKNDFAELCRIVGRIDAEQSMLFRWTYDDQPPEE